MQFSRDIETLIIFGTYNRFEIAKDSLNSLLRSVGNLKVRVVVVSSSAFSDEEIQFYSNSDVDFIWAPGDVSMAMSRNIAFEYGKNKYVFDWVMFVEDDLIYEEQWYNLLIDRSKSLDGKMGPHGLVYKVFTASPGAIRNNEICKFDENNDCYSLMFGARADQRLCKTSFYFNILKEWDNDVLGISSAQTGKQSHRATMRGFCACSIGHMGLSNFHPNDASTWVGQRDIGPAAFDKRLEGHESIFQRVEQLSQPDTKPLDKVADLPPQTTQPMTAVPITSSLKRRIFNKLFRK